mmetsp:Transcript_13993/g.34602  ORF Transcript_13993/g.34602 Transcript_13993/m.34602 type:complete len:379 (+) Transcript_13993:2523-3659(+)
MLRFGENVVLMVVCRLAAPGPRAAAAPASALERRFVCFNFLISAAPVGELPGRRAVSEEASFLLLALLAASEGPLFSASFLFFFFIELGASWFPSSPSEDSSSSLAIFLTSPAFFACAFSLHASSTSSIMLGGGIPSSTKWITLFRRMSVYGTISPPPGIGASLVLPSWSTSTAVLVPPCWPAVPALDVIPDLAPQTPLLVPRNTDSSSSVSSVFGTARPLAGSNSNFAMARIALAPMRSLGDFGVITAGANLLSPFFRPRIIRADSLKKLVSDSRTCRFLFWNWFGRSLNTSMRFCLFTDVETEVNEQPQLSSAQAEGISSSEEKVGASLCASSQITSKRSGEEEGCREDPGRSCTSRTRGLDEDVEEEDDELLPPF